MPSNTVHFSKGARLVLGLIVALVGYLVGSLHIGEEMRGAISVGVLIFSSAGIVPPTAADLPFLSPAVRFVLVAFAAAGAYVISIVSVDPTVRGVIVAVLALASSVGIVPPQAKAGPGPAR